MRKKLCIAAFFVVSWSIWMQRNKIIFELYDLDPSTLCHTIKWRIALWSKAWKEEITYFPEELARNFHSISILLS